MSVRAVLLHIDQVWLGLNQTTSLVASSIRRVVHFMNLSINLLINHHFNHLGRRHIVLNVKHYYAEQSGEFETLTKVL